MAGPGGVRLSPVTITYGGRSGPLLTADAEMVFCEQTCAGASVAADGLAKGSRGAPGRDIRGRRRERGVQINLLVKY